MQPDDPTRPLRPADPLPPVPPPVPPPHREVRETVTEDPFRAEVMDRLASLRSMLAVVGALAALALGAAVYALLTSEEEGDTRRGASATRVDRLDDRVDGLEQRVDDRATKNTVGDLRGEQKALDERVDALEKAGEDDGADEDAASSAEVQELRDAIEAQQEGIDELGRRVEELEAQQQGQDQP